MCFFKMKMPGSVGGISIFPPGTLLGPYLLLLVPLAESMLDVKRELCFGNQTFVVGRNPVPLANSRILYPVSPGLCEPCCWWHVWIYWWLETFTSFAGFPLLTWDAECSLEPSGWSSLADPSNDCGPQDSQLNVGLVTKSGFEDNLTVIERAVDAHKFNTGVCAPVWHSLKTVGNMFVLCILPALATNTHGIFLIPVHVF